MSDAARRHRGEFRHRKKIRCRRGPDGIVAFMITPPPKRPFSLGPFLKCPCPEMVETCGLAGFDFAIADLEHTPLGTRELLPLLLAASQRGIELIVRIPENLPMYFKWCLDLGAPAVQVPHVQTREDAQRAVSSSSFGASGERGVCRFVRAADYSATTAEEYLGRANTQRRLILQVEGSRGVRNIDEILSVKGIDTIFIGPYDLSQSLGHPGEVWHPDVVAATDTIIRKCAAASVRVGTFADTAEGIRHWVSRGAQMIEFASDLNIFLSGAAGLQSSI
jgi:4-hydroxy-2-oxoheptanedioate aldolase